MAPFNFESERCIFRALAHEKPDGGCRKPKGLADIIFHVSFIGKMHQLRLIHKQDERGRLNRYLCCIVDFQAAALIRRRFRNHYSFGNDVIERAGRNAQTVLRICEIRLLHHLADALAA